MKYHVVWHGNDEQICCSVVEAKNPKEALVFVDSMEDAFRAELVICASPILPKEVACWSWKCDEGTYIITETQHAL